MAEPRLTVVKPDIDVEELMVKAESACDFLKALSTPTRLMLLCSLMDGERSVTDLAEAVGAKQSLTSHHLNRLKQAGMVETRRDEKFIYYRLSNPVAMDVVALMYDAFCKDN